MKRIYLLLLIFICQYSLSQVIQYKEPYTTYDQQISQDYYLLQDKSQENIIYNYNIQDVPQVTSSVIWGSGSQISDDGTVTVTYTWTRDGFGRYTVTYYVNGTKVDSETFTTILGWGVEDQANKTAKEIANKIANEKRNPIGNCAILLLFALIYGLIIKFHISRKKLINQMN